MTERRLKAAANQAVHYRNYRRARDRALTRLATAYPETYKELLEQEKANDEQLGKKWLDLNGTTTAGELGTRPVATAGHDNQTSNQGTNQSNDGGKA